VNAFEAMYPMKDYDYLAKVSGKFQIVLIEEKPTVSVRLGNLSLAAVFYRMK
jgi:hypothetical protein